MIVNLAVIDYFLYGYQRYLKNCNHLNFKNRMSREKNHIDKVTKTASYFFKQ